jgi:uncharacterized protein (UPF0335 family)
MDPFRFHQYLTEKLRTLKEFLSISESMRASLDLPDMGEVTRWMAKRQELIGRIDRMDDEIRRIAGKPPLSGTEWPERLRDEILLLYRTIEEVLQTVKTFDDECQKRIAALRNEVKTELQKAFQGMLTVRGYMGKAAHPSRFLDVRR